MCVCLGSKGLKKRIAHFWGRPHPPHPHHPKMMAWACADTHSARPLCVAVSECVFVSVSLGVPALLFLYGGTRKQHMIIHTHTHTHTHKHIIYSHQGLPSDACVPYMHTDTCTHTHTHTTAVACVCQTLVLEAPPHIDHIIIPIPPVLPLSLTRRTHPHTGLKTPWSNEKMPATSIMAPTHT